MEGGHLLQAPVDGTAVGSAGSGNYDEQEVGGTMVRGRDGLDDNFPFLATYWVNAIKVL